MDEHAFAGAHGFLGPSYRGKLEDKTEVGACPGCLTIDVL